MSEAININPEKEPIPASWVPRVIQGGKGPTDPPDPPKSEEDWLSTLQEGTTFLCRQNTKTVDFEQFYLLYKQDGWIILQWFLPDGKIWDRRVDPKLFSNLHKDYKVINHHPIIPPEEEVNNE